MLFLTKSQWLNEIAQYCLAWFSMQSLHQSAISITTPVEHSYVKVLARKGLNLGLEVVQCQILNPKPARSNFSVTKLSTLTQIVHPTTELRLEHLAAHRVQRLERPWQLQFHIATSTLTPLHGWPLWPILKPIHTHTDQGRRRCGELRWILITCTLIFLQSPQTSTVQAKLWSLSTCQP